MHCFFIKSNWNITLQYYVSIVIKTEKKYLKNENEKEGFISHKINPKYLK